MQPTALVAVTTWWPLSAQLAVSLLNQGCAVEALCPPGHPLHYVSGVRRCYRYHRVDSLAALRRAIAAANPDVIIPGDDSVVQQLHQLHREQPALRALIERSLGSATHFETVASRQRLLQVAQELHIRVPRAEQVSSLADCERWFAHPGDTAVMKQDGTWGGNGVRVVHSLSDARQQLTRMLQPVPRSTTWKRLLVNHDPVALWTYRNRQAPAVTLQEFIKGRPANLMMACWEGNVLGAVAVEVLWSQGATGAATVVRLIEHSEMALAARRLAKRLNLSGFHGLDFMLEAETDAAYLIELNPRCTQLGHLPLVGQGDLASLLVQKLGAHTPAPHALPGVLQVGDTIAFFPKALCWNPTSPYLWGYHDVPWQEPALVKELLRESWPNRQWPARLYHWLRPLRNEPAEGFEQIPSASNMPDQCTAGETRCSPC